MSDRSINVINGYKDIITGLGYDIRDPNLTDTPARVADYMMKTVGMSPEEVNEKIKGIVDRKFPGKYKGMVIERHIHVYSLCPHHLLPIQYDIDAAYVPRDDLIGLSKIPRIAELLTRTLMLQEEYTDKFSDVLFDDMNSQGSMVVVEGSHGCITLRGVELPGCTTVTSSLRGVFRNPPKGLNPRDEFLRLTGR